MFSRLVRIILLVVVALGIVACSATPTRRSFKEGWKDSVISTKVKFKLTKDKFVEKRNFDVDTWRGIVTLTGRARTMEEKERAEQLAWQVRGVRGVDNFLKVVDDASLTGNEVVVEKEVVKDSKLKVVVKEELKEKKPATHPVKPQVSNKVEGPVVFEDDMTQEKTEYTAKRGKYNQPTPDQITEEDLTDEERLANEAAEELKKLRGEEAEEVSE